jgi:hypothetical protein
MTNRIIPGRAGAISETGARRALLPGGMGVAETVVGGPQPVAWEGSVPTQNGTAGVSFSFSPENDFTGDLTPFTYTLQAGSLAGSGLTLNSSTGAIAGATPVAGSYTGLVVRATDTGANTADTNAFTINIVTAIAFGGTVPAQDATEGVSFSLALASYFSGTLTPFSYAVQSGSLPPGLSLNASTGAITGTPTTPGTYSGIVIRATDTGPNTADTNSFAITVAAAASGNQMIVVMMG